MCVGDCPPPDGRVAVNELVLGVNIALGGTVLGACPSYDVNGDGRVDVAELVMAVNDAERGCAGGPSPAPSASPPPSAPPTPVSTFTPTVTATPALGPVVEFFGVAAADDSLEQPAGLDPAGIPIYQINFGYGFILVVEAGRGAAQGALGTSTFDAPGPPDLQIQATRDLGNGSAVVCDDTAPNFGGVPGIAPPDLGDPSAIAGALNDFGCRFIDGSGMTQGRTCAQSCIRFADGEFHCVEEGHTEEQFCAAIDRPLQFPGGDTLVTARVRDVLGNLGPPAQLIIRVGP